ncbi:unknown protein [Seminavis robusta]|uniref:Uncharacterized protein n=1 Tax=Seminavis robusta TaxID=568900 RepID=A0A9N8HPU1_9STRA|nr:unknown protein [Seminavis robusta]|eukprot:Sro928_g221210.1 n/a (642) ;mRNA; f:12756-15927
MNNYHRPVYVHEYDGGEYDVVMFTGARWALTSSEFLLHGGRIPDRKVSNGQEGVGSDIGNFFKYFFHAYNGYYGNYTVSEETGKLVDSEFLCHVCHDDSNPCLYDGKCKNGTCECSQDSFGGGVKSLQVCMCTWTIQVSVAQFILIQAFAFFLVVKNGHCDPFFNAPEFKMDSGDCCESTCQSTPQYTCGAAEDGYVSTGYYYYKSLWISFEEAPNVIQVYEAQEGLFEFRTNVTITRNGTLAGFYSLSLSEDGSKLAVQSLFYSEFFSGSIVVLAWDELSGDYATETELRFETDLYTLFPLSLALNQDGTVLAYGFPECQGAQLHIFTCNDAGVWVPRRAPQMNTTGCIESTFPTSNNALAVSGDGSVIAFRVGSKVRVYRWEAELKSWNSLGDEFPFTHYPVAMSPEGKELAISSPEDRNGGVTAVYALPGKKECPTGMSLLRLSLTLDSFPAEVAWNLVNNRTGEILFEQDSYPQEYKFATILEETCVPADSCYTFTIEQFGSCASCPAGTELFSMMILTCGPMEWALLKLIEQGVNKSVLHEDNNFDKVSNQTVYPPRSDDDFLLSESDCKIIPDSHDACLDPAECYELQVSSNKVKNRAYVEIVFGEQRVNTIPETACEGQTFFVGREDKCLQEED